MSRFSIVVIAQNERSNIRFCLEACVKASDDVWVVDSFSTDETAEISEALGAKVVQHEFTSWGAQRNYALDKLDLTHDYVLLLDADEQINDQFAMELARQIDRGEFVAFNVNFDIVFLGRVLRHSHENPPVLRVVKRDHGKWVSEGAREYCVVNGAIGRIRTRIRHEDRKGIFFWLVKHIRNAEREASLLKRNGDRVCINNLAKNQRFERPWRVRLRRVYDGLPMVIRPGLVFFYRYFLRLGFLDGYAGLVFCLLQAFWYHLIIDIRLYEMGLGHDCYLPPYGGCKQQNGAASLPECHHSTAARHQHKTLLQSAPTSVANDIVASRQEGGPVE